MHFYAVVALSAFLLFLVQPLIAKQILPWFGGSSAVWTTCMLFFQGALLLGYAYSDVSPRALGARQQPRLHMVLALVALLVLPIIAPESWKPEGGEEPISRILLLLAVTIGLPYVLLSTTSPLIQSYFARLHPGRDAYRLFALSNAASLAALVAYPVVIEPFVGTRMQALGWSVAFALFVLLLVALAWRVSRAEAVEPVTEAESADATADVMPATAVQLRWIALSAAGSMLLLAVSNHITQNVASVPLLWILPLTLYLLTFILTFDGTGWYKRRVYAGPFFVLVIGMCFLLVDKDFQFDLIIQTSVFCVGLFVVCMVCHGELVLAKPAPTHLTRFYLLVSIGGALGALIVSVAAPLLFSTYLETAVALLIAALLFVPVAQAAHPFLQWLAVALAIGVVGTGAWFVKQEHKNAVDVSRNFYGVLKVKSYDDPGTENYLLRLVHGAILHGEQYPHEKWRREPTTYYTPTSGFGRAVNLQRELAPRTNNTQRIGMIGLGVGTVAAYCREGDICRIYEINAEVERLARKHFTYLADAKGKVNVILGDARLSLEREASNQFNVLAVDAFSGDSIPMHLITQEAVRVFMGQVAGNGIVAYHVSNRFLNLPPVLAEIAEKEKLAGVVVEDPAQSDNTLHSSSTWVLLARNPETLKGIGDAGLPLARVAGAPLWTDDFNNLLSVVKWRH
jgi:MFS family permease